MDRNFITLTEKDCRKRYPNGYFAAMEKNAKGAGIVLLIMGVIFTPIGLWLLWILGKIFVMEGMNSQAPLTGGDIVGVIFIFAFPLIFLALGIFCLWMGVKRRGSSTEEWLHLAMEQSGYTEDEMREFDRQVSSPGSISVILTERGQLGAALTGDYFMLGILPMKINDIRGAYLVSYPDVINTGKAIKTIQRMNLAVFSNRWTFSRIQAKPNVAQQLQVMLLERNPEIDTAGGRVLSDKEYDEMEKEYIEKKKCINN